jgi:hypothetical protein
MTTPQQPTPPPVSDDRSDDSDTGQELKARCAELFKLIDDHLEGRGAGERA